MAELQVIYWRDIPAQIIVKLSRREQIKRVLPDRFAEAIDMAAMRAGLGDDDDYLNHWRKGDSETIDPEALGGDLESLIDQRLAQLVDAYPDERVKALIKSGGAEGQRPL